MPRLRSLLSQSVVVVLAMPMLALAEPSCDDPAYESQAKQNACAELRYRAADLELNRAYKTLVAQLPSKDLPRLRAEQRAWLKALEPGCSEPLGPRHQAGNMWAMEFYDCLAQATAHRTKALAKWAKPK